MPLIKAEIRRYPSDFEVAELFAESFSGDGEHAYLWVEKSGANTDWTATQLARFAGIPARDVGYAGLKDRHAITRQWFSVRAPASLDWSGFDAAGVRILRAERHHRKLRRGAHRGNRFRIALRSDEINAADAAIESRLAEVRDVGIPNFFGQQRFGRGGANLRLAEDWAGGKRLPRHKRSIAISAARSAIFNAILERRVAESSWNQLLPGDMANLDGSGSVFAVDEVTEDLVRRCAAFDIHPTGTLWGDGAPVGSAGVAELELEVAKDFPTLTKGLQNNRVDAGSRPLRLLVKQLDWEFDDNVLWLEFELPKGGFATTVLGQIADCQVFFRST